MTVAVMQTPVCRSVKYLRPVVQRIDAGEDERRSAKVGAWSEICKAADGAVQATYVHPLVRRSLSSMSLESLQICTESLGSESGSDGFSDHEFGRVDVEGEEERKGIEFVEEKVEETEEPWLVRRRRTELAAVNYQCSSVSRRSPPRWFPPPLTSISRRDGPCLSMRSHRRDGRLVVEAVSVPSRNYLHADREGGRLLLSIVGTTASRGERNEEKKAMEAAKSVGEVESDGEEEAMEEEEEEEQEEEEEEEVEVVDRGTVVEFKVSTQPQQQSTGKKVLCLRSSVVINKFVGGTLDETCTDPIPHQSKLRRPTTATSAAAAVVASTISASIELETRVRPAPGDAPPVSPLLFTSKRRNREAMLHSMRRCSQLRWPLFFLEPCFIAASS